MRYREAYELIDAAVNKAAIGYPVTETLKAMFFDQEVENIGLRLVKKSVRASFSVSGKEYVLTDEKRSNKIYKVELEDSTGSTRAVPYIDDSVMFFSTDEDTIPNIGYTLRTDATSGSLTAGTRANPCSITAASHGLDSPAQLLPAAIHRAAAQIINLDGNLQLGSGHRGLAKALEAEYMGTDRAREAMPDLVPQPLQDFVGK